MEVWAIAKQFEMAGFAAFVNNFMGIVDSTSSRAFIRLQNMEISPDFYALASIFSPWRLTYRMRYIGTTSYWVEQVISCRGSEKELVRLQLMAVRIDPATRRPIPLAFDRVAFAKKTVNTPLVAPPRVGFLVRGQLSTFGGPVGIS